MASLSSSHLWFGADYNPEQWPEDVWEKDVRLMRQAGVNIVSLGIFSWANIQHGPEDFRFEWMDRVMDLLHGHGIAVNLATGTASPPAWLVRLHPEMLPTLADGSRLWQGARQHYNPSSRAYREACAVFVRRLAGRYGSHPALVSWHINNEYGCHVPADYGDETAGAFRRWLSEKYGSLDALNSAWGTAFWSQRYGDWEEILPPRAAPMFPNPCQSLDFLRFSDDALLQCHLNEARIVREITPHIPVNTNFMLWFRPLHHRRWAHHMDYVSLDCYPEMTEEPAVAALNADLTRSCKDGDPWILMEQVTTHVNWRQRNSTKPPGVMRLWSYQHLARGSDGILFFQWRQSRAGAEKFHGAMVGEGEPSGQRCFRESCALGGELARLGVLAGTRFRGRAAILHDQDCWWGVELPSKPNNDLKYQRVLNAFYRALHRSNIATDFVFADTDGARLADYPLLFVPTLYLVEPSLCGKLEDYVRGGGTAVFSYFSGVVDATERLHEGGVPGPLRELLGLEVREWAIPDHGQTNRLLPAEDCGLSFCYPAEFWAEVVHPTTAEIMATFESGFFAGAPALTRHRCGRGEAWYLATDSDDAFYRDFVGMLCKQTGIEPPLVAPPGVEVTERQGASGRFLFLLNHNPEPAVVALGARQGRELLSGEPASGELRLDAYGVALIAD